MQINIVTIFPGYFEAPLALGILGRAARDGLVRYGVIDLRNYAHDPHRTVDDYAYGGGAGMVMKPEPFFEAVEDLKPNGPIILLCARGKPYAHEDAVRLSLEEEVTLLCGHYKDVDARVAEGLATESLSVGDFVLSGGEPAALCVVDSLVRLLPGAVGEFQSAATDSFFEGLLAPPMYTRPAEYRGMRVPEVLLSGDHARIDEWRGQKAMELTRALRPDLWARWAEEHGEPAGGA